MKRRHHKVHFYAMTHEKHALELLLRDDCQDVRVRLLSLIPSCARAVLRALCRGWRVSVVRSGLRANRASPVKFLRWVAGHDDLTAERLSDPTVLGQASALCHYFSGRKHVYADTILHDSKSVFRREYIDQSDLAAICKISIRVAQVMKRPGLVEALVGYAVSSGRRIHLSPRVHLTHYYMFQDICRSCFANQEDFDKWWSQRVVSLAVTLNYSSDATMYNTIDAAMARGTPTVLFTCLLKCTRRVGAIIYCWNQHGFADKLHYAKLLIAWGKDHIILFREIAAIILAEARPGWKIILRRFRGLGLFHEVELFRDNGVSEQHILRYSSEEAAYALLRLVPFNPFDPTVTNCAVQVSLEMDRPIMMPLDRGQGAARLRVRVRAIRIKILLEFAAKYPDGPVTPEILAELSREMLPGAI